MQVRGYPSGEQHPWGIPFRMAGDTGPRVIIVSRGKRDVTIPLNTRATFLCILHAWNQIPSTVRMEDPTEGLVVAEYERSLIEACGQPPMLDWVLLGIGDDGHTASLFPQTDALAESERFVVVNRVPALGASRMTLTYPALALARHVVFLVVGAAKAGVVKRVLAGDGDLPASRVLDENPRACLMLDTEAASGL